MTSVITSDSATTQSASAWATFSEHVTIAGAEDLHKAEWLPVRILFVMGLVLATIFGIVSSIGIVKQYWNEGNPVEIIFDDDGRIPFPNVTICTTAVNNITAARELLVISPEVERKLKEMRADREQFINDALQFTSMTSLRRYVNETNLRQISAVLTATAQAISGGVKDVAYIMRHTLPPCHQSLSNCAFNGEPFECCQDNVLSASEGFVCYGIPVSRISNGTPVIADKPIMFNADARMDWNHIPFIRADDAFDGFLVIVGQPYTGTNNAPVAVAPGWHGTIKLTQIKRRKEYTNCVQASNLPKLDYSSYYDEDGKSCELELVIDLLRHVVQCTPALASYVPHINDSCTFLQTYTAIMVCGGLTDDGLSHDSIKDTFESMSKYSYALGASKDSAVADYERKEREMQQALGTVWRDIAGSFSKRCRPICQRWQYETIVGYSELRSDKGSVSDHRRDVSWSRITVTIPSAYYEEHREGARSSMYVQMCNIGGALGVCLGLSAVTVVQAVAYGYYIGYTYKNNRRKEKFATQQINKAATLTEMACSTAGLSHEATDLHPPGTPWLVQSEAA